MFKEGKRKLMLLSVLSAVVVASTVFAGSSIYAQMAQQTSTNSTQGQASTEATNTPSGAFICNLGTLPLTLGSARSNNNIQAGNLVCYPKGGTTRIASSTGNTTTGTSSTGAECNLGTIQLHAVSNPSIASANGTTTAQPPTISAMIVTKTQISSEKQNVTSTANSSSATKASCFSGGTTNSSTSTSPASNSTLGSPTTSSSASANNSAASNNSTGTSAITQWIEINGTGFTPSQALLVLSDNKPIGIDQVDSSGHVKMILKVNETNFQMKVVETGTLLSGNFQFNGQALTSTDSSSQIKVAGSTSASANSTSTASIPSGNSTSSNTRNTSSGTTSNEGGYQITR